MTYALNGLHPAPIHDWHAFWTVVCLGLAQIAVTWYNNRLTIESLPAHVPAARRRRHRLVFTFLLLVFVGLTFALARLNDAHQYQADLIIEKDREKQRALEDQLQQTLDAVNKSGEDLTAVRALVEAHPQGAERASMLDTLDRVSSRLNRQAASMQTAVPK